MLGKLSQVLTPNINFYLGMLDGLKFIYGSKRNCFHGKNKNMYLSNLSQTKLPAEYTGLFLSYVPYARSICLILLANDLPKLACPSIPHDMHSKQPIRRAGALYVHSSVGERLQGSEHEPQRLEHVMRSTAGFLVQHKGECYAMLHMQVSPRST